MVQISKLMLMNKISNKIIRIYEKFFISIGSTSIFIAQSKRFITEVKPSNGECDVDAPRLLALSPFRFRGDLEALADSKKFQVFKVSDKWQKKMAALFYPKGFKLGFNYYDSNPDTQIKKIQDSTRKFFLKFLKDLYAKFDIDCVIGACVWYPQDYEWGYVSRMINTPYVVLHRENLITGDGHYEQRVLQLKRYGIFSGNHIIVHNERSKKAFVESGYVTSEKIDALGCVRMDEFIKSINAQVSIGASVNMQNSKKVTFFSFQRGVGLRGVTEVWPQNHEEGYTDLFAKTHVAFAQLALDNPDIEFVIKAKWGGGWLLEIEKVLLDAGIKYKELNNLIITGDGNAQDLIFNSDVIVCFGSTTLLEAGVANKFVVIPYFDEALDSKHSRFVHFKKEFSLFKVANNIHEFKDQILEGLENPYIDSKIMDARYKAFEEHVSFMDCSATEKYSKSLKKIIKTSS